MEDWIPVVIVVCFAIVAVVILKMIFRESSTYTPTLCLENFSTSHVYLQSFVPESTFYQRDLHKHKLREAMEVFKTFLRSSARDYKNSKYKWNKRYCNVITGRGKHSPDGEPVIKPAVENYLKTYNYTYKWINPGMVRIDLSSFRERVECD